MRIKLTNSLGGREFIDTDADFSIGRKHDNDVILYAMNISRYHARVYRHGDEWFVEDLQSLNGTLVNHQRVSQARLNHGDTLSIGHYKLTVALVPSPLLTESAS